MTIQASYPAEALPAGASQQPFRTETESSSDCSETYILAGESAPMQRLRLQVERIGPYFRTVLVRGESGTGKHLVASALHARSRRSQSPLSRWTSAQLEVDQHEASSAVAQLVQAAQQGTVFLDGVDEMSPLAQKNLLAALGEAGRLRIIAAARQDIRVMTAAGLFRHDLYSRLSTVEIVLEPLRSRAKDVPVLANLFLGRFAERYRKPVHAIAPQTIRTLLKHSWPGNVRELEKVIHNAVLHCEGMVLLPEHLSSLTHAPLAAEGGNTRKTSIEPLRLQEVIDRHVIRVLRECSGNKVRAAEVLGISRSTLYRMLDASAMQTQGR